MANYLVSGEDLTSIADAIRTKGGTSSQLVFPDGFEIAIDNISGGITPTGTKQISITQNGKTTEDITNYANVEITVNVQGGGATIKKEVGSFTPASNVLNFEVTGFDNPPIVVLVCIHDPTTNSLDGVIKCLGGMYAYGDSMIIQTNSGGTGYGRDQNTNLIPTWLNNYTVYQDGELAPTATIIATATGFAFKSISNFNYGLKAGYTYDWVAYTYPAM